MGKLIPLSSSQQNLSEQVPKLSLSQADWKKGESQQEYNQSKKLKKVTQATDLKRKEVIDYMAKGNRWRYFIFWVFGGLILSVLPSPSLSPLTLPLVWV